ncbi:MAG: hypothetical protein KGI04_02255 [Candidatus Micrarchaeota archaeon]|nr:hypothetical protein [Candidatus Micrarchaeota archaeon]
MQTIKKLGVMSVAKIEGVIGVVVGFIIGILVFLVGSAASSIAGTSSLGGLGALSLIIFPIVYGIMLFIFGAVIAWVYNMVAGEIGGIQIDLE